MTIEFNFSCDESKIDISKVKQAGYDLTIQKCAVHFCDLLRIDDTNNDYCQLMVTNSNGLFIYIASNMCLESNEIIIPAQTNAYFYSDTHPVHDMGVFANLQELVITNIRVGDEMGVVWLK